MSDDQEPLEQEVTHTLTEGDMEAVDPSEEARKQLTPRHEIRIQVKQDPIVKETERYRQLAHEVDNRYDGYVNGIPKQHKSGNVQN
jgi:hypothetical protein